MDSQQPTTVETAGDKPGCASVNGWKHEPVTSEQAKEIVDCLKGIKSRLGWLIYWVILIWFLT